MQQTQLLQQQLANIQSNGLKDIESTLGLYKAIKDKLKQESNKQLENVEKWRPKPLDTSIAIHHSRLCLVSFFKFPYDIFTLVVVV